MWVAYYYNGRDEAGKRVEIPLGTDLIEAKRKWAELECKPPADDVNSMMIVFDRYVRDVIPTKAPRTRKENLLALKSLRKVFGSASVDQITPQHLAQYRDNRAAKVSANRELSLLSHVFNMAREWGYTAKENPCRGVRKNKETGRDFYVDDLVWDAVLNVVPVVLQQAMQFAYLSGQRPAGVLKMRVSDIENDSLLVRQNKTTKFLKIDLVVRGGKNRAWQSD